MVLLHNISDGLIWLSYLAIPMILVWFVRRRRDTPFPVLFWLFGAFIISCGFTHLLDVVMFYNPLYRLAGLVKAITALVSVATVVAIIRILPTALRLRTPAEVEKVVAERTIELGRVNAELHDQMLERSRADSLLHQERERIRLTLDTIKDGVISIDKSGRISSWNPAAELLYGWSNHEILGKPFSVLFPPDSPGELGRILEAIRRGERMEQFETVRITKKSERINVSVSIAPIREPDGKQVGAVAVLRDVTSSRRSEEAIRQSEEQYRFLAESVPQMVWTAAADGAITYSNQKTAEYTGEAYSQTHQWKWDQFIHPSDYPQILEKWANSLRRGIPHEVQCRIRRKDGAYHWHVVRGVPFKDPLGRVVKWVGTCTDIDDQKRAEERFRRLVEHAGDGFFLHDLKGSLIDVNEQACISLGYSRDQLLKMSIWDLNRDADRTKEMESWRNIQEGEQQTIEELQYRRDGTSMPVESRITLFEGETGKLILRLVRDLTERRQLESQFHQSQKMEAVGHLAAGIAHDFNNLLTVISGYGDLALRSLSSTDPSYECVTEMTRASERAGNLTRQLLAFSKKAVVAPKILDLNSVVLEMEKLLQRLIGEDLRLATKLEPMLGLVKIDPGQIEQVILNLVVNARDSMPEGGTITITTANEVGLEPDHAARCVALSVSDTGTGITPEVLDRLFEPFFTTKEKGKGSGLGLATVQGIVKQANGQIKVESVAGVGTIFKILLPTVEGAASVDKALPETQVVFRAKKTILLVEDEEAVRTLTRRILQAGGHTVLEARNGAEAIQIAQVRLDAIDLLVTDVVMPGIGGRQLADRILALRPELPVLYLSGYTDDAVVRHGILQDEVNFLHKPFTPNGLNEKVKEIFESLR